MAGDAASDGVDSKHSAPKAAKAANTCRFQMPQEFLTAAYLRTVTKSCQATARLGPWLGGAVPRLHARNASLLGERPRDLCE